MSSVSSPESVYDEPLSPVQRVATPPPPPPPPPSKSRHQANPELSGTWRSTLPPDVYESLSKRYGPTEMARQELIYSLYDSEKTFIKSSRHVIRTYFVPLRARDTRTWLLGLPPDVARLFDWLEDIVNLHVAVARALSGVVAVWKTGAVVERVAGTLRAFVPQLEIYMPYLVKLESVRDTIRWHAEKDGGELGEYLRMKERERVEGEWALEKLFEEAAARLHHYLEVFQVCVHIPYHALIVR
ncbi:hypothetical protein C8Q76DRAFT_624472 [Earliella scabrosa]|nr:hypothetical protein C8Q76DRAFT_624472 [Earliella scabrosa]